ncbi:MULTISPECIES: hypothetical protein [unclassified Myroides]|uniref:hypothetical protein n=1 Tax=unclassified Myroides TaxID=2642485 RepID=UPI003D2F90A3
MEYEILYSVLKDRIGLIGFIPTFIGIGALVVLCYHKEQTKGRTVWFKIFRAIGLGGVAVIAFMVAFSVFTADYKAYREIKLIFNTGAYGIAEGEIEEFTSELGGRKESFFVQGIYFEYHPYDLRYHGYNERAKSNGIIHEKSGVLRIDYVEKEEGKRILRIWQPKKKDK